MSILSGIGATEAEIKSAFLAAQNRDAFERLRVSQPFTEADYQFNFNKLPLYWDESVVGGGSSSAHQANRASVLMTVGAANADKVIRQSKRYFRYQPGKGLLLDCTFVMGAAVTDVARRVGYFDDDNGLFLEQDGAGNVNVVQRSFVTGAAVDTKVAQPDWNIDPMDGTGPSGLTLDLTKGQILQIDTQWLGTGDPMFGFFIDRTMIPVHTFANSNVGTSVFMSTGNLPIRYEIENLAATAGSNTFEQICSTVQSEGGFNPLGTSRVARTSAAGLSVSTTLIPIVSIRLKAAFIRATLELVEMGLATGGNTDMVFSVLINPTLTGAAFASLGANTITEIDTTASALSGGDVIDGGVLTGPNFALARALKSDIKVVSNIAGTPDILTLAAETRAGSVTTLGSINFRELF